MTRTKRRVHDTPPVPPPPKAHLITVTLAWVFVIAAVVSMASTILLRSSRSESEVAEGVMLDERLKTESVTPSVDADARILEALDRRFTESIAIDEAWLAAHGFADPSAHSLFVTYSYPSHLAEDDEAQLLLQVHCIRCPSSVMHLTLASKGITAIPASVNPIDLSGTFTATRDFHLSADKPGWKTIVITAQISPTERQLTPGVVRIRVEPSTLSYVAVFQRVSTTIGLPALILTGVTYFLRRKKAAKP